MWEIRRYRKEDEQEWNEFVARSRNSTFLFSRRYMEYHSDRFADWSLMAYRGGRLLGILPANREGNILHSHQGLTYGGWVWGEKPVETGELLDLWEKWLEYCLAEGIEKIIYKSLPYIYAKQPSEEYLYFLFLSRAKLAVANVSTTIDLSHNPGFDKLRRRNLGSALSAGIECKETNCNGGKEGAEELVEFHEMLTRCLRERHDVSPVHSLKELQYLAEEFPENIRLWVARRDGEMLAGVLAYVSEMCVHCQYIASTQEGRDTGALTALFNAMIEEATKGGKRYFDFGISNEEDGLWLNRGLNRHKTSLGGTATVYSTFVIDLAEKSDRE